VLLKFPMVSLAHGEPGPSMPPTNCLIFFPTCTLMTVYDCFWSGQVGRQGVVFFVYFMRTTPVLPGLPFVSSAVSLFKICWLASIQEVCFFDPLPACANPLIVNNSTPLFVMAGAPALTSMFAANVAPVSGDSWYGRLFRFVLTALLPLILSPPFL